jgi:hypothetical protein
MRRRDARSSRSRSASRRRAAAARSAPTSWVAAYGRWARWPILKAAGDRELMGDKANGRLAHVVGWLYFGLICVLTVAAPVLLVVTNGGGG